MTSLLSSDPNPLKVVGFGHPLLDIISNVDSDFLKKYAVELGSVNLAQEDQLAIFEELSQRRDVEFVPGGAAMNTIRVVRWMMGEVGSGRCAYVGCLGDDEFGSILHRSLTKGGVGSHFQRSDDKPTGTCAVLIVEKERSLLANLGAALQFSMSHFHSPQVTTAISNANLYYCEGFFLNTEASPQASLAIGKHCADNNKIFTYNLSAPYLCHIFKDRWAQVVPYIDVVFGSRIDILAYAEAFDWEEKDKDMELIMRRFAILPKINPSRDRLVVITGGSDATFVATKDSFVSYPTVPVPLEEIVDTNGAGDAFVGGFLSKYVQHQPIEVCVHAGHLAAGEIIRNNGCTFGDIPPSV